MSSGDLRPAALNPQSPLEWLPLRKLAKQPYAWEPVGVSNRDGRLSTPRTQRQGRTRKAEIQGYRILRTDVTLSPEPA
jgi:hypothetical protein